MDTNTIQVIDDNGNTIEYQVLFTFDSDETGKKYVLYYNANDEEPQVYSSIYDDEGNLYPIETPEEWDMVEEVFNSFISQNEDDGCCGCGGHDEDHECCGGHHGEDHECCGGHHGEDHECCGGHHDEDHECCCHKNEG